MAFNHLTAEPFTIFSRNSDYVSITYNRQRVNEILHLHIMSTWLKMQWLVFIMVTMVTPFVKIIPCWMRYMWKFLFSWKFPGNLKGMGCGIKYNHWSSLFFVVIMPDYDGERSYQYFDVWYVDSPWSSSKIFLKYHTGCKSLKKIKIWNFAKILYRVHKTKKVPRVILMPDQNLSLWHILRNISLNNWPIFIPIFLVYSWEQALQLRYP